jgi:glycosyltransferase involved in cell wall biosynthesis
MPGHDVAIYLPYSVGLYSRRSGRAGGAERQMVLLARALAERGVRVAHVVYPVPDPVDGIPAGLDLVPRAPYAGPGPLGAIREALRIARALERADARVLIVRTGTPVVGLVALYSRVRRRRFVFSAANDSDFLSEKYARRAIGRRVYHLGVRRADAIVLQSRGQLELAARAFPGLRRVEVIPSLAEEVPDAPPDPSPELFTWIGRLVPHKRPELFPRLAEAIPEARFVVIPQIHDGMPQEEADMHDRLRSEAARLANFEVRDPMPNAEIGALIASSVAVVSTSRVEGMPNIFLEAWSHGIPVLSLLIDPDEVVERHGLGVAAGGDWDRFVTGARELWATRTDRGELSRRTRAYVRETHSASAVAARWADLITELGRG